MATIREEITKLLQSASDEAFADFMYRTTVFEDLGEVFCTKYEEDEDGGCKWSHRFGCFPCFRVWITSEAKPEDVKKLRNELLGEEE